MIRTFDKSSIQTTKWFLKNDIYATSGPALILQVVEFNKLKLNTKLEFIFMLKMKFCQNF